MLPGTPKIIICPNCHKPYLNETWASANTFGATLWSDGFMEGPGIPVEPDVVSKCHACSVFFVAGNAIDDRLSKSDFPNQKIPYLKKKITQEEILMILQNPSLLGELATQYESKRIKMRIPAKYNSQPVSEDKFATYLKTDLLFKINHFRRSGELISPELQKIFESKAAEVIEQLPEEEEFLIIQKAEWCRNLGRFDETLRLLKKVHDREFRKTKRKLRWAAWLRQRKLMRIFDGEKNNRGWLGKIKRWVGRIAG